MKVFTVSAPIIRLNGKIKQFLFSPAGLTAMRLIPVALLSLSFILAASSAHASTSNGAEFAPLLTLLTGWILGIPGIIAAIAISLGGLFMAFSKGITVFFVALIIAAAIFTIPSIATGIATSLGGATFYNLTA